MKKIILMLATTAMMLCSCRPKTNDWNLLRAMQTERDDLEREDSTLGRWDINDSTRDAVENELHFLNISIDSLEKQIDKKIAAGQLEK